MAGPAGQLRVGRYFGVLLAIIAILYALVFLTGNSTTPRLGLDLRGGTTVTLTAVTDTGKAPSAEELETARQIIERRVNGLGVASAEVVTEGDSNIVISVPGDEGEQAKQLGATAKLEIRPVVQGPVAATPPADPSASAGATGEATTPPATDPTAEVTEAETTPVPNGRPVPPLAADATDGATPPATDPAAPPATDAPATDAPAEERPAVTAEEAMLQLQVLDCSKETLGAPAARPDDYVAQCSTDGTQKYLLGPTLIPGTGVDSASAGFDTQGTRGWLVTLNFDDDNGAVWSSYTAQNVGAAVAFSLDSRVLSAPQIKGAISGTTEITGDFTEQAAKELANSLNYGALPLTFTQSEARTVSATLGIAQLEAGLIAGGIGLALVVVYCLLYYRLLGLVTVASLVLSGVIVYAVLVLLGQQIGFTLTLAGIAGFIVAIGITADSFVIFFEMLKDEVRDGRSMRSAVPRAWVRARRTILSADAVSFLAAAILYLLAVGEVRGFAFTLGLSTILDLVVVFFFTHPLVSWMSRFKAFASPRISGLGRVVRTGRSAATSSAAGAADSSSTAKERAAARRNQVKEA